MRLVELIKVHYFWDPRYKRGGQEIKVTLYWGGVPGAGLEGRLGAKSEDGVWGFFLPPPLGKILILIIKGGGQFFIQYYDNFCYAFTNTPDACTIYFYPFPNFHFLFGKSLVLYEPVCGP